VVIDVGPSELLLLGEPVSGVDRDLMRNS